MRRPQPSTYPPLSLMCHHAFHSCSYHSVPSPQQDCILFSVLKTKSLYYHSFLCSTDAQKTTVSKLRNSCTNAWSKHLCIVKHFLFSFVPCHKSFVIQERMNTSYGADSVTSVLVVPLRCVNWYFLLIFSNLIHLRFTFLNYNNNFEMSVNFFNHGLYMWILG